MKYKGRFLVGLVVNTTAKQEGSIPKSGKVFLNSSHGVRICAQLVAIELHITGKVWFNY